MGDTMWRVLSLLVAVSFVPLETVEALILQRREVPAVVTLDIKRNDVSDPVMRDRARRKRDTTTVSQALDNEVCEGSWICTSACWLTCQ